MNLFDNKRMYLSRVKSLPWDKHTQPRKCGCIILYKICIILLLYYKEICDGKTDEEIVLSVWYLKQTLTHQQLLKLISDRAEFLTRRKYNLIGIFANL